MAIALIGSLPPTLASRSIHVPLQRRKADEPVERYRAGKAPYAALGRQIARWADDNRAALHDADPPAEGLANRHADNWRALVAIADRVGKTWPARAREAALTLTGGELGGESLKATLLADIRTALGNQPSISSTELAKALGAMEGRPWPEYGRSRKPITTNGVARLLKPLMIKPHHAREGNEYLASDFSDAFERYLGP
jgi:hypothetical protein